MKAKGGGPWTQKGGGKVPKGQELHSNGQQFNTGPWRSGSSGWEAKEGAKGGAWEGGVSAQGVDVTGGEIWHAVSSNQWTPKLFLMESALPGLELNNSFAALDERDSDDPIPLVSVEDFPTISAETVFEKKCVPRVGKFKKKTQTQQKASRWQRAGSLHEVKQEVNGVQELYPLLRVEEREDQPGLHAVSESSRWMCTCPLTGFTKVKIVLDSGATDSCAPDCVCPVLKSRP